MREGASAAEVPAAEVSGCVFCGIVAGQAPAQVVARWSDAVAFVPLNPVVDGHTLVVPTVHVPDYTTDPEVSATVMRRATELAAQAWEPAGVASNVITSAGTDATQTVFHLHLHLVPRRPGDGLALPWTGQPRMCRS